MGLSGKIPNQDELKEMTLLKNLKQAAEKATPGPWSFELFGCASSVIKKNQAKIQVICREPKDIDDCARGNKDICGDNFEYIALASPDNVLKLIEALENSLIAIDRLCYCDKLIDDIPCDACCYETEIEKLLEQE